MDTLRLLAIALGAAVPFFLGMYAIARRIGNFGIVDVVWSAAFAPVALFYAAAGRGDLAHRRMVVVLVVLWSGRLALHLGRRVLGHLEREDGRYADLRRAWAETLDVKMAGFFVLQAVFLVVLSVPFALAVEVKDTGWTGWDVAAWAVGLVAIVGETVADAQLAAYKRDPANDGGVCDRGLWRLSRHPNYFFEWLVWIAFALLAWPAPHGWVAVGSPLLMGYLLLCVTGIPYTEAQLLRSKGEAYRDYQRRTSVLVPWFPRR